MGVDPQATHDLGTLGESKPGMLTMGDTTTSTSGQRTAVTPDDQPVWEVVDKVEEVAQSVIDGNGWELPILDGIDPSVPSENREQRRNKPIQSVGVFSQGEPNLKHTTGVQHVIDPGDNELTKQGSRGRSYLYPLLEGHRDYRVETLGGPKRRDRLVGDGDFIDLGYPTAWGKGDKEGKRGLRRGARRCKPPDHHQA
jgi:hypothetical protein